ncbi:MAG: DHH family phosphoesterase [Candidatus Thermoplasmatota archaeon]|jgi:RecJ-like exonuclease|nr:DHH family phosphoesterase [Candidatus Thermoplasmatota archaeon]
MLDKILNTEFLASLEKAREFFNKFNYFRILAHYDGDGTSSAIILTNTCLRAGKKFHLGFVKDLSNEGMAKRFDEESAIPTIFVDCGSGQVKSLTAGEKNVLILDHHFYSDIPDGILNVNARDYGIDGTRDACGATMAFIFSVFLDSKNSDLIPFMITGAIADKQDMGGFTGINRQLIEAYGKDIDSKHILNISGENLVDAIVYSIDPFIDGLTGSREGVEKLLKEMNLDGGRKPESLTDLEKMALGKFLSYKLMLQGCQSEAMSYLEREELFFKNGFTASDLSKIIDANAKNGDNSIPVEYFMGNDSLRETMIQNKRIYETKLIDYITRSFKSLERGKNIQYFYAPGSEMAGAISGALMLYLADQSKPLIGFNAGDKSTLVSGRGTRKMVESGLNLSNVMKDCSAKVEGSGGGHDIAAGASIPRGREKQFVELVDEMVGLQLKK